MRGDSRGSALQRKVSIIKSLLQENPWSESIVDDARNRLRDAGWKRIGCSTLLMVISHARTDLGLTKDRQSKVDAILENLLANGVEPNTVFDAFLHRLDEARLPPITRTTFNVHAGRVRRKLGLEEGEAKDESAAIRERGGQRAKYTPAHDAIVRAVLLKEKITTPQAYAQAVEMMKTESLEIMTFSSFAARATQFRNSKSGNKRGARNLCPAAVEALESILKTTPKISTDQARQRLEIMGVSPLPTSADIYQWRKYQTSQRRVMSEST